MTQRDKFLNTAKKILDNHGIYLWGAQGEKVLSLSFADISKMETTPENAKKVWSRIVMIDQLGWLNNKTKAFDCSGYVCYCLVKSGREKAGFDLTADGIAKHYPKTDKLVEGCLLHRPGHIGIYIGNGYLLEAKGRAYGITLSPYNYKEWDLTFVNPWVNPEV